MMTVTAQPLSSVTRGEPDGAVATRGKRLPQEQMPRSVPSMFPRFTRAGPVKSPATAASARRSQRVWSGSVRNANRVRTGLHQIVPGSSAGSPPRLW